MATDTPFVRGADKLRARLQRVADAVNLAALVEDIGQTLERRTIQRFDREIDPDEQPWAPLSRVTLENKKKLGCGNRRKLVRTGELRSSIRRVRGTAGLAVNTGAGFRIGITDPRIAQKGRYLNFGTRKIPARRFLGIGMLDIRAVDGLLRRKAKFLEDV